MTEAQGKAVVMGASAGALEALSKILPTLPGHYSLPIMIVVHVPADKKSLMVGLLQTKCPMRLKEMDDKESIEAGTIYFAPPDYHMLVETDKRLSLSNDEPVLYSRPSIDVLFETAAKAYGPALIGVILTGANADGAKGLKAVMERGGTGVVLTPEFAYASAMPLAALKACPDAMALNFEQIAEYLQKAGKP